MCLLMTSTAANLRNVLLNTAGLIEDIYTSNADGFGVMYATTSGLKVCKIIPNNAAELRKFISRMPEDDRNIAAHARMRTHGDIDLANCHPYSISETSALMHNGVLSTGNAKDKTKSDTWHYINDFLAGVVDDALHSPQLLALLADHIGDNRFAIMSADGRLSVVNKDQGIEHGGVWFSNTYAWTPELVIPNYRPRYAFGGYSRSYTRGAGWEFGQSLNWDGEENGKKIDDVRDLDDVDELVYGAVIDNDVDTLAECLDAYPVSSVKALLDEFIFELYKATDPKDLTLAYAFVLDMLIKADSEGLERYLKDNRVSGPTTVAECTVYFSQAYIRGDSADVEEVSNEAFAG